MGVSENSGTPKSSILIRFSIINHHSITAQPTCLRPRTFASQPSAIQHLLGSIAPSYEALNVNHYHLGFSDDFLLFFLNRNTYLCLESLCLFIFIMLVCILNMHLLDI